MDTLRVGSIEIAMTGDGYYLADGGGLFGLVPRTLWQTVVRPDEANNVAFALRCPLIRAAGKTILIDTGYGDKVAAKLRPILGFDVQGDERLPRSLAQAGVTPEDVDIVVNTHLHADHCGGNTRRVGERLVPAFPRAEYWVQRLELADANYPNERTQGTYFADNFMPLIASGQLKQINGDTEVVPGVRTWMAPGHTRSHQVLVIEDGGQSAVFLADAVSWAVFLERLGWVPSYDLDPMTSIETKRNLGRWILRRQTHLLFQHDGLTGRGRLEELDGKWRVVDRVADVMAANRT